MKLLILLCAIQMAVGVHLGVDVSPREHRFMVSIQFGIRNSFTHTCGGVIINQWWVLTADSCYQPDTVLRNMIVVAGNRDLTTNPASQQIVGVDHNRVVRLQNENLALVRLNRSLDFDDDFVFSIRLPAANVALTGDAVFMGWPPTRLLRRNILQRVVLPIAPTGTCNENLDFEMQNFNFCTGPFTGGRSTCERNEGGPLFRGSAKDETLLGILVRRPANCGNPLQPTGIFTNIAQYISWITENTRI